VRVAQGSSRLAWAGLVSNLHIKFRARRERAPTENSFFGSIVVRLLVFLRNNMQNPMLYGTVTDDDLTTVSVTHCSV
jgi:hypothetical protein